MLYPKPQVKCAVCGHMRLLCAQLRAFGRAFGGGYEPDRALACLAQRGDLIFVEQVAPPFKLPPLSRVATLAGQGSG